MSRAAAVANRLSALAATAARVRFERAAATPAAAQRTILRGILRRNAETDVGTACGFGSIRTPEEFRSRVPPGDYDVLRPAIERMAVGETGVLTAERIRCFEPTGGSSGPSKLVPYTTGLLAEVSAATLPWVFDLVWHRPGLRNGSAYWAVSPPARNAAITAGGTPIGLEHDSDYFPRFARSMLDRVIGTPRALARVSDLAGCRYVTLLALLARRDLSFISVWSPSFLTLLAGKLDEWFSSLVRDMESGEISVGLDPGVRDALRVALPARPEIARALRRRFGRTPPEDLGEIWERLDLVSCWADGHASRALGAMRRRFPYVDVQPKGLLATEGVVSFPLTAAGGAVAAVTSHYLELVPDHGREGEENEAIGIHEAESGRTYEVLLTTSGGLYRYRTRDLVRVDGWYHRTPVLTFVGRADAASDLAGEKLTPEFVETVIHLASRDAGVGTSFAMLAPVWRSTETPFYALFIETDALRAERLAVAVERRLCEAYHYRQCRDLGQLSPVRARPVEHGEATFERVCLARGQRAGSVKPAALDARLGWEREFGDVDARAVS